MIADGKSAEPLTPAEFEAIRAMRLEVPFSAYTGTFATDAERELYAEAGKHYNARLRLVAEVEWLAAELADARATVAKAAEVGSIVWRAEHNTIPLGTYLDRHDARAACEHEVRARTPHTVLTWNGFTSDDGVLTLWAERTDGGHDDTGYLVVPLPVLSDFDPDGES